MSERTFIITKGNVLTMMQTVWASCRMKFTVGGKNKLIPDRKNTAKILKIVVDCANRWRIVGHMESNNAAWLRNETRGNRAEHRICESIK